MRIFGLACLAAVNPKLLGVDLILMGNRRPRLMFVCFLLGGIGLALTIGLLNVFVCTPMPSTTRARPAPPSTCAWGSPCWPSACCWQPATCTAGAGAIMQSIFSTLLTAGYAAAVASAIPAAPNKAQITASTQGQLEKSFSSAAAVAHQYPQYASAITAGAKTSFLHGANWAYAAGVIATAIGIVMVFFLFPTWADGAAAAQRIPGSGLQQVKAGRATAAPAD